ncbi:MAG: helix-turn-helix domain-containing protein [Candidatus Sulfotelmatobacter sp.]
MVKGSGRLRSAKSSGERLTYDVSEAGRLLGIGRNSAYAAAKAGLIPTVVVGGRILVPKLALHEMLSAGKSRVQVPAGSGEVQRVAGPRKRV